MDKKQSLYDLRISPLGYGCYALSGAYGTKLEEYEMIKILQYAYELGIKIFDTAGSYTGTEEILGRAIKPFRHDIVISSKVGITEDNRIDLSKESIKSSCESSLRKLKTDYIDIYQIHYHDSNTPIEKTIEALELLKKEGKIKYYGIGHLPLDKTEEYLNLGNISFVMAEMSPVNTYRYKELHPLQEKYNFDIIAFSITGRGLLSGKINEKVQFGSNDIRSIDPLFKKSRFVSGIKIAEKLREIGNRYNMTPTQVAILWTIHNKGVVTGLTGPTKIEHLEENSRVLNLSLDIDGVKEINQLIEKEENKLRKIMYEEVYIILTSSFPSGYEKSYKDIIYAIEYCIENQLIPYKDGIDIYMRLVKDKSLGNKSLDRLNEIRNDIKSMANIKKI
ncbi:aldo/keto reductase [Clostridium sp. Cult2]|uniref:aldo/keto reductase n=1 Tax=Clostridium sp. Cult2 TaxID=2079003 RepID=UPI001F1A3E05|nr:aldo/keto reductase [Clostridium sp. Cult2]